jgi:integrase
MTSYAAFETLAEFESFYREEICPAMAADDDLSVDPEAGTPPYAWLKSNYSGFVERLRRDYDLSPGEFYDEVGLPRDGDDRDHWGLGHEPTNAALDGYITELARDRDRAESTVDSRRARLRTYVTTYSDTHGRDDLLSSLLDETVKPDEIARTKAVFRVLDDRLGTLASKRKYVSAVKNWYTYLEETGRATYNPARNLTRRFGWDRRPVYDHPALSTQDLDALLAVGDPDERFLLLLLAGWGLRPVEACQLHVEQLVLDPADDDTPHVSFAAGERKNARRTRNTVAILVGTDAVRSRIDRLESDDWSGHLLPSPEGGPITTQTARRWLRTLGERADVTVEGEFPKPKMGRRTWYRLYRAQRPSITADTAAVADAQGSSDPSVSERNYLDERTRREARADAMADLVRDELAAVFDQYLP